MYLYALTYRHGLYRRFQQWRRTYTKAKKIIMFLDDENRIGIQHRLKPNDAIHESIYPY